MVEFLGWEYFGHNRKEEHDFDVANSRDLIYYGVSRIIFVK
jgi:hypothetical protein